MGAQRGVQAATSASLSPRDHKHQARCARHLFGLCILVRRRNKSGEIEVVEDKDGVPSCDPPKRVFLLRHGQAEHNVSEEDVPDALLTDLGRQQARAWRGAVGAFGAEVVLISPLRRAVETALLAFEGEPLPMELCRPARELWWEDEENTPSPPEALHSFLKTLPRGDVVRFVDQALQPSPDESEEESVEDLRNLLRRRPERRVMVACHWGVIDELCGVSAKNGEVIECSMEASGKMHVVKVHAPPNQAVTSAPPGA